jgi:hypothetical protein
MKRYKPKRFDPLTPLVIVAVFGFLAYVLFIIQMIWG